MLAGGELSWRACSRAPSVSVVNRKMRMNSFITGSQYTFGTDRRHSPGTFISVGGEDLGDSRPSPRTKNLISSAVQWADRIMNRIDGVFGNSPGQGSLDEVERIGI
jgi:hypothetical protein